MEIEVSSSETDTLSVDSSAGGQAGLEFYKFGSLRGSALVDPKSGKVKEYKLPLIDINNSQYVGRIQVGDPKRGTKPQFFDVIFDSGSSNLWINSGEFTFTFTFPRSAAAGQIHSSCDPARQTLITRTQRPMLNWHSTQEHRTSFLFVLFPRLILAFLVCVCVCFLLFRHVQQRGMLSAQAFSSCSISHLQEVGH